MHPSLSTASGKTRSSWSDGLAPVMVHLSPNQTVKTKASEAAASAVNKTATCERRMLYFDDAIERSTAILSGLLA